ncbi:hypothetical protein Tco_1546027 [Tanacetum coccineum]
MDLGYQNPFYLKQAQHKQQSLYNGKVLLEKYDPPAVSDSEGDTANLSRDSSKNKTLNKEINAANYAQDESYFGGFLFLNGHEVAKFFRDFKSLANEADASLAKHKALEFEIERLWREIVSQDIMFIVQNPTIVETSDLQTELEPYNDMQQKIERLQAQLGDLKGKSKDTSCVSNTLDHLSQKLENENVIKFVYGRRRLPARNSPKRMGKHAKGNTIIHPPVSLDEHVVVQRENKVRTLLLQALPEDDMPDFHHYEDAKGYLDGSKARFGGMKNQKKIEGKTCSDSSLQNSLPDNDDINLKFLRALPSSWSQVALALKTRGGLESMSFDDLYNKLRSLELDVKIGHSYGVENAAAPLILLSSRMPALASKLNYSNHQEYCSTTFYRHLVVLNSINGNVFCILLQKTRLVMVEKVYGMMARLHADNGGADVSKAAAEFGMMGTSPKGDPSTDNDIGIVDSGCSSSMTGNKENLDDFVQVKGGIVKFGGRDGRISGKGTIRDIKLALWKMSTIISELQPDKMLLVQWPKDPWNESTDGQKAGLM